MRLWHIDLLPYLPDAQFKGQLRELVAIMHDWRDKGTTNHLLINKVMEYPKSELVQYYIEYELRYAQRYGKYPTQVAKYWNEFRDFNDAKIGKRYLDDWHNKEYLRVCMANLYEKHFFGVGKSRITDEEWQRLLDGYKAITGEEYQI
jgi:uncharacterized protein (TIGR02328 family)